MLTAAEHGSLRMTMIGPMPGGHGALSGAIGGTVISFEALVQFLAPRVAECRVIDTAPRTNGALWAALRIITQLLVSIHRTDVVTMHFSDRAAITIAPIIWTLCKLSGKPCVFRQFGGEFDHTYSRLPTWWKRLLDRTIFRSDAVFLQTKAMMREFSPRSDRLHWFPTARIRAEGRNTLPFASGTTRELRCLFIGHVSADKGTLRAIHAVSRNPIARLDIFGPLVGLSEESLQAPRVKYRGVLPPDKVGQTMCQADVLLFPTMHKGEGYPGTLVEAAIVGLPIVASRWQSLPEMFTDDEVFFVPPGDDEALADVVGQLTSDPTILKKRSQCLLRRAPDFDAELVFGKFLDVCASLARVRATS